MLHVSSLVCVLGQSVLGQRDLLCAYHTVLCCFAIQCASPGVCSVLVVQGGYHPILCMQQQSMCFVVDTDLCAGAYHVP